MKIVPLGDNVVVKRQDPDRRTAGGIVLPDGTSTSGPLQGRVLSVGDGHRLPSGDRAAFQVSEGDRVLFLNYAGTQVNIDGGELLILSESDIIAVIS